MYINYKTAFDLQLADLAGLYNCCFISLQVETLFFTSDEILDIRFT